MGMVDETDLADVLNLVEVQFSKFTTLNEIGVDYDPCLSADIATALDHLYGAGGLMARQEEFESFCRLRSDRLSHIYSLPHDVRQSKFLHQPEALIIFHLLELDKFRLREEWIKRFPLKELECLAIKWGTPYAT